VSDRAAEFAEFYVEIEPRLRVALIAAYGLDDGRDAAAEALSWAWEHWERVVVMEQPLSYLYRVGQSRSRRLRRPTPRFPSVPLDQATEIEPALPAALGSLSRPQRVAVLLVHGFDWSHAEVAALLGTRPSTVATHVARGLVRLRGILKVGVDV
jgi:DNA-directed RNA polymerase specialized sigma24 family protein